MSQPLQSQVVLLDDGSPATIFPVWNISQVPLELVAALCVEYNAEVEAGRSFPQTQRLMLESFEKTWFAGISGVVLNGTGWEGLYDFDLQDNEECLGSFTITPQFPGRSSHICTANFLVKRKVRNCGVGKAMAQCFLRWATQLGYEYALFNLVYDCNIAACKILTKLGFEALTTLRGAGILKGFNYPVDAFVFGRSLSLDPDQTPVPAPTPAAATSTVATATATTATATTATSVLTAAPASTLVQLPEHTATDTRASSDPSSVQTVHPSQALVTTDDPASCKQVGEFENLRIYLMSGEYPPCSSRLERTRIRSRARSYVVKNEQLYHKMSDKLVVSDPQQQHLITSRIHSANHNGINKVQKEILANYYWSGVRQSIVKAIKDCHQCRSATSAVNEDKRQQQYELLPNQSPADAPSQVSISSTALPVTSASVDYESPASSHFETPRHHVEDMSGNVVYLSPENDDEEYLPEGGDEFEDVFHDNAYSDDDSLFMDMNDDDDEYIDDDGNDEALDDVNENKTDNADNELF